MIQAEIHSLDCNDYYHWISLKFRALPSTDRRDALGLVLVPHYLEFHFAQPLQLTCLSFLLGD